MKKELLRHISLLFFLLFVARSYCQTNTYYNVRTVAFYNVENLFDTINDPNTYDDDRTPTGKDHWNGERYRLKIEHISKVLSTIGVGVKGTPPDIIGLCEVENKQVVEDLIHHPNLISVPYEIIHFDSPDERGIDVALVYNTAAFIPTSFQSRRLLLENEEGERDYTRDQLVVGGELDQESFYFIVNHWPSRSGGEKRSEPRRLAAAKLTRTIIDSILKYDPTGKIIGMGDLNDDPIDKSLKKALKTTKKMKGFVDKELHNPMEIFYKKGFGTLAYRDEWNLFDQFFITPSLIDTTNIKGYRFWKSGIFDADYLKNTSGSYKGYPFRTYSAGNYTGGYSDHFPVYLFLIKPTEKKTE